MWKPVITCVAAAITATGQTATPGAFEKAPKNVSDALKTRVSEFYQDHVTGKYRKAELLVAADSRDGFYASTKPALLGFTLGDVVFSEHYTKAKVTVVGKMMMTFMGMAGPQLMDVPFPSYWKKEAGRWSWYIYQDPNRMTPFGRANGKSSEAGTDPAQAFMSAPDIAKILSGVKADKNTVTVGKAPGSKDSVTLTNQLAGPVTLALDAEQYPGLVVKLEPKELKTGAAAALTIETAAAKDYPNRVVRVLVKPSNQAIDVIVRFQ